MQFKQTLLLALVVSFASMANAAKISTVITFDNLADSSVTTYDLATWTGSQSVDAGNTYIQANHGRLAAIEVDFSAPVVFVGADYNSWGGAESGYAFDLFLGGNLVAHGPLDPNTCCSLSWLSSGYSGLVDHIAFNGSSDGAIIDNLSYMVSAVPVPAAVWLLGSGLLGLVGIARRKAT